MKHNHSCTCTHSNVAYCSHCRTVYCKDCNQEWTAKYSFGYYNAYPATTFLGNTVTSGGAGGTYTDNQLHNVHTTTCSHGV